MSRADPQINIRVPIELKKEIEHAAIENSRSLNAEVVHRLQESLNRGRSTISDLSTEELMEELSSRFGGLKITIDAMKHN